MNTEYFRHGGDIVPADAPFHYRRCGLDNIYLINGFDTIHEDGEDHVAVADVDGLHKAIGVHLVCTRKTLAPKEIRFLRRTLDLTQAEMGRLIGQSDQQIARWEKGENNISGPADRLLRLMYVYTMLQDAERPHIPMEFLDKLDKLDSVDEEKVQFCNDGADWSERCLTPA